MKQIIEEIILYPETESAMKSEVWEEKSEKLILAKLETPRITLYSNHYAINIVAFDTILKNCLLA